MECEVIISYINWNNGGFGCVNIKIWNNTHYINKALNNLGFDINTTETPIIPIYIRDNNLTFQFTQRLFEEGIFVNPVVSPAVKSDSSLIRMSIMATHTQSQLDEAISKIEKVAKQLNFFSTKAEKVVA